MQKHIGKSFKQIPDSVTFKRIYNKSNFVSESQCGTGVSAVVFHTIYRDPESGNEYHFAEKRAYKNEQLYVQIDFEKRRKMNPNVIGLITHLSYFNDKIVMPYYNHTLASLYKIDFTERVKMIKGILYQICTGIKIMHQNYIHNDIKPANILIDFHSSDDFVAVLSDFGLAKEIGKKTNFQTRDFRAPEIVCHEILTTKADIYSLGLSILCFLDGTDNFMDDYKNYPDRIPLNYPYKSILLGMISHDRTKRPDAHRILKMLEK